jgi:DNA-binding transcriptional LysR family regulator
MKPFTTRQLALTFAIAISGIGVSASPGLAFSSEAQQLCTGDAMRLCSSEIPDIPRITACMHRKRAQVSPGCRALMDREVALSRKARRAAAAED